MGPVDEAERRRFLESLRGDDEFRSAVRRELLTDELLTVPQVIAGLAGDLRHLAASVQTLTETVSDLAVPVSDLTARVDDLTVRVSDRTTTVDTLVDAVAKQREDFKELAVDVRGYMERTVELVGDGFTAVRGELAQLRFDVRQDVAGLRADMDARFNDMDARFNDMEARFTGVDARFIGMDARFIGMDAKFDQVSAELRDLRDRPAS